MKNAKQTATAVEELVNATNLTPGAALAEVQKQEATQTAAVAEPGAANAPAKASSKKDASKPKGAPKAKQGAKKASPKAKAAKKEAKPAKAAQSAKPASKKAAKAQPPREFSKKSVIVEMLRRKQGVTMSEIAKATNWQNHSIRGFISGMVTRKLGHTVESTKRDDGQRVYRLCGAPHKL